MQPAVWIGILALGGGLLGYAVSRGTGWFDAGLGVVVGVLIGALIYGRARRGT